MCTQWSFISFRLTVNPSLVLKFYMALVLNCLFSFIFFLSNETVKSVFTLLKVKKKKEIKKHRSKT